MKMIYCFGVVLEILLAATLPLSAQGEKMLVVSVLSYGALGDGKSDNTAAFQKALNSSGEMGGGIVEVPAGQYRFEGTLKIPANVTLRGTFTSAPNVSSTAVIAAGQMGSLLLPVAGRGKPEDLPFISFQGDNGALEGFVIYYPEWSAKEVPPIPYPPTVAVEKNRACNNLAVQNVCFTNSYEAIRFILAPRHLIRNVTGYPIYRGILVDDIGDIGRIENVHFWPFNYSYSAKDPYCLWINQNGVAFEMGFTDWQILSNCFSFGYGVGYKFSASATDPKRSSCGKMVACGADSSNRPMQFDAAYSHWLIGESEFVCRWEGGGGTAVDIGPGVAARISFSNCAFWGPIARVVTMRAPDGIVSLEGCQINDWEDAVGAISIDAGRAILRGNSFDRARGSGEKINRNGKRHLLVGKDAGVVIASDNLASPKFDVEVAPEKKVNLSNNQ